MELPHSLSLKKETNGVEVFVCCPQYLYEVRTI